MGRMQHYGAREPQVSFVGYSCIKSRSSPDPGHEEEDKWLEILHQDRTERRKKGGEGAGGNRRQKTACVPRNRDSKEESRKDVTERGERP